MVTIIPWLWSWRRWWSCLDSCLLCWGLCFLLTYPSTKSNHDLLRAPTYRSATASSDALLCLFHNYYSCLQLPKGSAIRCSGALAEISFATSHCNQKWEWEFLNHRESRVKRDFQTSLQNITRLVVALFAQQRQNNLEDLGRLKQSFIQKVLIGLWAAVVWWNRR